jgi:hypothetical protein
MTLRLIFAALAHCNRKGEAAERCKKSSEKCVLAHHSNESRHGRDKAPAKRLGELIHEALLNPRRSVRPKGYKSRGADHWTDTGRKTFLAAVRVTTDQS